MLEAVRDIGVELRGAGTDESPFVYRKLARGAGCACGDDRGHACAEADRRLHGGADEFDPYKD